jgi:outer membrane protein assembly factor BamE (lipoprotein component of BamABCDE complex)
MPVPMPFTLPFLRRVAALCGVVASLSACASSWSPGDLRPGASRDDVTGRMGQPVATYPMPGGGQRLEYSHMPAGLLTWMVDLDASGRLLRAQQVLDEQHFAAIGPGLTEAEVRQLIGPPSERGHFWLPVEADTWRYRFQTVQRCVVFELSFDVKTHRTLEHGSYPPDTRCGWTMS